VIETVTLQAENGEPFVQETFDAEVGYRVVVGDDAPVLVSAVVADDGMSVVLELNYDDVPASMLGKG
jgi:hypothetical protein